MSINTLQMPASIAENRYYPIHIQYIIDSAKAAGIKVTASGNTTVGKHKFKAAVDGKPIIFDYSNFLDFHPEPKYPGFKFQYSEGHHENVPYLFPFTKVNFYNWSEFKKLKGSINYRAAGDFIISRQRPYGGATKRRRDVQRRLISKYGQFAATAVIQQNQFWNEINKCLVAVFVPGARNDILDRGHVQYMALGCCTIAPKILDIMPYMKKIVPGVHYVMCKPDYSDLINCVEWCKTHRKECIKIGNAAKQLFDETSTPEKLWKWVDECVGAFKYA